MHDTTQPIDDQLESLSARLFQVQCEACGQRCEPTANDACPVCATALPGAGLVQAAATARRCAFKGAIGRLEAQARPVLRSDRFPKHPDAMAEQDYLQQVLRPAIVLLGAAETKVRRLLEADQWDPCEPASLAAFSDLAGTVKSAIAEAARLREIMPPLQWRSTHRNLARAAACTVNGLIEMAAVVAVRDHAGAVAREHNAQQALTGAACRLSRILKIFDALVRQGAVWRPDGSVDMAQAAWSAAGGQPTTISQAADLVREAFSEVPGMADAADEHLLVFLPVLGAGAFVVDHDQLAAYSRQLRSVLDLADADGAWIVDPDLLIARCNRATLRTAANSEQIMRAANAGLPRSDVLKALAQVYLDQVEGALRDLGSIVLIAARAARGDPDSATYCEAVIEGVKAGEVVEELVKLGPPCKNAVAMIYRNAAAHASIEITEDGLKATSRRIAGGRVVETREIESTDAQFAEDVTALHELLLALQLTIVPWLGSHSNPAVVEAVIAAGSKPDAKTRTQIIGMLSGLEGLQDIMVLGDATHLTISVSSRQEPSHFSEHGALKLVPAGFGSSPDVQQVALAVDGRPAVTYHRHEVEAALYGDPLTKPVFFGLFTAKWLLQSRGRLTESDQAALITIPLTEFHINGTAVAVAAPIQAPNLLSAAMAAESVRQRLNEVVPPQARTELTARAACELDILVDSFRNLAPWYDGQQNVDPAHLSIRLLAASVDSNNEVRSIAIAIHDRAAENP